MKMESYQNIYIKYDKVIYDNHFHHRSSSILQKGYRREAGHSKLKFELAP